jgi:hypothetical protein
MSMNRFRVWGLSTALAVGVGGPVVAADPPAPPAPGEQTTLMSKLFGPRPPKPTGSAGPLGVVTITAPLPADVLAEALRAERDAYLRRMSVCTELRRIAVERGDDALVRQTDELERQAGALYNARVAALGVPRTKSPLPEPTAPYTTIATTPGEMSSARMSADKLVAPAAPIPASATAQVREVKP